MTKAVPHILVAAARKSSGKTSFSLGLARALARRGLVVQTYKKGPDYIDPLWLERASGRTCFNLDFNTMSDDEIVTTFRQNLSGADFAIIETNKGLFDGLDVDGKDSNAALAKLLGSSIVLVIDTIGMTRGIAPLLHGYQTFDPDIEISGVVLNKTGGPRHAGKLKAAIAHYNNLPVLGVLARDENLGVDERHLGLATPGEVSKAEPVIDALADAVARDVDLDEIFSIGAKRKVKAQPRSDPPAASDVTIGVARDAAFGFYYTDDLAALRAAGAELKFFNALSDTQLPRVDGLFIGGGFPETSMDLLSQNKQLRRHIHDLIQAGLPTYAECGGLMYLCDQILWDGASADMVGIIPACAVMNKKPQGRGFARLKATPHAPWTSGEIAVHEFHYACLEGLPDGTRFAYDVTRGHGIDGKHDGIVYKNMLANFCHLRHTDANRWATSFVDFVRHIKTGRQYKKDGQAS